VVTLLLILILTNPLQQTFTKVLTYLRNNPSASVDIIGHADELGRSAYNDKLSNARAAKVQKHDANIATSRLNVRW
jgi:OOP family OmpA-OmpF porin